MKTKLNERSFNKDFAGFNLCVRVNFNGDMLLSHYTHIWEALRDSDMLNVKVVKSVEDRGAGGLPGVLVHKDSKEFEFTFKQYREFIKRFHEEGADYFDMI